MAINKNINRIKVVLAEKSLTNKWLAEKLGKDKLPYQNGAPIMLSPHWKCF